MRGGFAEGCRNRAAFLYAWFLHCNGVPRDEAARRVSMVGAQCRPSLTSRACKNAIRSGYAMKMRRMKDATIVAYLQITAEEMELLLELEAARKKEARKLATSPTRAQTRHQAILAIIRALDQVPSSRAMSSMLRERGHHIKHSQVAIDYRTLHVRQGAREPSLFYT